MECIRLRTHSCKQREGAADECNDEHCFRPVSASKVLKNQTEGAKCYKNRLKEQDVRIREHRIDDDEYVLMLRVTGVIARVETAEIVTNCSNCYQVLKLLQKITAGGVARTHVLSAFDNANIVWYVARMMNEMNTVRTVAWTCGCEFDTEKWYCCQGVG